MNKKESQKTNIKLEKSGFTKEFEDEVLRKYNDNKNFIGPFDNIEDAIKELHK